MKNIAIFASGSGSNAEQIMQHFSDPSSGKVALVVSNKPNAFVLERAHKHGVETYILPKGWQKNTDDFIAYLQKKEIDLIVLAGFMQLIPSELVKAFSNKIINIHPALLPKYGGKGMYGMNVHKAVQKSGEKETGISIHFVNERYDEGNLLFQASCPIAPSDSPESIQQKVQRLEHYYFPLVIDKLLQSGEWGEQSRNLSFTPADFPTLD